MMATSLASSTIFNFVIDSQASFRGLDCLRHNYTGLGFKSGTTENVKWRDVIMSSASFDKPRPCFNKNLKKDENRQ